MAVDTKLKLELNIDLPVFWSFNNKGMGALEETARSCKKLAELPLFNPEAERKMISVQFISNRDSEEMKSTKTYSVTEYIGEKSLGGRSYSVDEVERL